jgi:O-antigen ligase
VAGSVALEHPVFGSGPGTFQDLYRARKPSNAEMSLLVHNDYLQQAMESGWLGGGLFAVWIAGALAWAWRRSLRSPLQFALWLGLVGWATQEFVEFGLLIPALAWPAVVLLGWLAGGGGAIRVDTPKPAP